MDTNKTIESRPEVLWEDPCECGWLCHIKPSPENTEEAIPRKIILANRNNIKARTQREIFSKWGCSVLVTSEETDLLDKLHQSSVLVLDATSYGDEGPTLVHKINQLFTHIKVIVLGDPEGHMESAYREQKIFYYALEPLGNKELIEVMCGVFKTESKKASIPKVSGLPLSVCKIKITNRHRQRVTLLASRGVLREQDGLGRQLIQQILDGVYPLVVSLGSEPLNPLQIRREASECDRMFVLLSDHRAGLPGSLSTRTSSDLVDAAGEREEIQVLHIEPPNENSTMLSFDYRTDAFLAKYIANIMATAGATL